MVQKTKTVTGKAAILPACVLGLLATLGTSVVGALIGGLCILNEYVEFTAASAIAIVTQFLSVFLGAFIAGKFSKDNKMLAGVLSACAYCFVLIAIAILLFDGIGSGIFMGLLTSAAACLGAILLNTKEKRHRKQSRRGRRNG